QFQDRTDQEVLRADGCRRGAMAGFGKFLGRSHEGRARAHGFQSNRYRAAPDQRQLAAGFQLAVDAVTTRGAMAEGATRTDHKVAERKRPGLARRSEFYGE